MEAKPKNFIVGLFVLIVLALGTFFVVWFSKLEVGQPQNLYLIYFDGAVTGLRENEDVLYQGIAIGKVKQITVYKEDVERIKVMVSIRRPDIIRENSVATIEAQGLTGNTFVQIKGSTQDSPILKAKEGRKYPVIHSNPSNLETLFSNTPKLLNDISKVSIQLQKLFDDQSIKSLQSTFANLNKVSGELASGSQSLKTVLVEFQQAMTALKGASGSVDRVIVSNEAALAAFAETGLPALTKMSQRLEETAVQISKLASDIEKAPGAFFTKSSQQGYPVK